MVYPSDLARGPAILKAYVDLAISDQAVEAVTD
jgi:hypothetical protein